MPVLIPGRLRKREAEDLNLPELVSNLFGRLIRNPLSSSGDPRELECTEMLCAILLNTFTLRNRLLGWLAALVHDGPIDFQGLDWRIETEQNLLGKRDDLRIEAWAIQSNNEIRTVLWSVEVKVGSGFHSSPAIEPDQGKDLVHQICNYDSWLAQQEAQYRAGFVLAKADLSAKLPKNLHMKWKCVTWGMLASEVEDELRTGRLGEVERFLARHLLGFIHSYLWEGIPRMDERLDFDDLALWRAFAQIGDQCGRRIDALVKPLETILEEANAGIGHIRSQQVAFASKARSIVYQSLIDEHCSRPPYVFAGLVAREVLGIMVWLETTPNYEHKPRIHELINSHLPKLKEQDARWEVVPLADRAWWDLKIQAPLEQLLTVDDQALWVQSFVAKALDDLKSSGLLDEIQRGVTISNDGSVTLHDGDTTRATGTG